MRFPRVRLRTFVVVLLCGALVVFVGSIFMRRQVIKVLRSRAMASSSVVVGRSVPIRVGDSLKSLRLESRLKRLGYQKVEAVPQRPGDYTSMPRRFYIFLRSFQRPDGTWQPEELVRLDLGPGGEIQEMLDSVLLKPLNLIYLQPEVISFLGDGATRAVTPHELKDFPRHLIDAVVSIEDERFNYHFGIDPIGIGRAAFVNITRGRLTQGGSTLTQQLAKNLFFGNARRLVRKIVEVFSAVLIETAFTKEQILEMYLNEVFLGQEGIVELHGFGEAAESFFGKDVRDLTLAECATLAGIISAPSARSPRRYPEVARKRRSIVLKKMLERGVISVKEAREAEDAEVLTIAARRLNRVAPYFVDFLRPQFSDVLVQASELKQTVTVHSTLEPAYQVCARDAVVNGLKSLEKQYPRLKKKGTPIQGALIASDPLTGEVLAWVGGRDYGLTQFDRVSNGRRQPGSLFKPFVYLTALDGTLNNYRAARTTMLLPDEPLTINVPGSGPWEPRNYDNQYRGEVTVREALAKSLNVPTVNLALKVGIDNVANTAELLGLGSNLPRVPALALGAVEATPLEMLRAYTTIASGGILLAPKVFESITAQGEVSPLALGPRDEGVRVANPASVYVLTDIMKDVIDKGTAKGVRKLGFGAPAAGKTGTTNEGRDAWFVGFTPQLLAVTWVGFDDNSPLGLTGGAAAVPIWTDFMKCALAGQDALEINPPDGVVFRAVEQESGLLFESGCSGTEVMEVFVQGTEPITNCFDREVVSEEEDKLGQDGEDSRLPEEEILEEPEDTPLPPARTRYQPTPAERFELQEDKKRNNNEDLNKRRRALKKEQRGTDLWERIWSW